MPSLDDLKKYISSKNLAEDYEDAYLAHIGNQIVTWFDIDEDSCRDWKERNEQYLKLAAQVVEQKTYPWPNAANVKFPLLTTAAMQFAARAYPALVPGPNLVAGLVIGRDEGGKKQESAQRVGRHMSYQLLYDMPDWEEEMDKLCLMLPIVGCLFKKTYYDPIEKKNRSELVLPTDLIIDYYAKTVESAARKCQILWRNQNEVQERINRGVFLDVDLGRPSGMEAKKSDAKNKIDGTTEPTITPATPHKFIECHCFWDLDEDGYEEPYIVTVHYDTRKVVRIVARFDETGIETEIDDKGKEKLIKITPIEYFTKFGFIPNPDGSIYDLGFGLLLGGINESVNTLTNQLLDAGTLNNLQGGFLGRGIRIRGGNTKFVPGEWKPVDFTGDDIKKHIFPIPTKEPSDVLFKLLETLVTSGKELASVAEIFVGKMPGQNTPATTTMATIEQGLKVFTAIYKRIYRSLNKEYAKLYRLNAVFLPDETIYFTINEPQGSVGQEVNKTDYDLKNIAIKPNSDPNVVSSAQKLMKVQSYGTLLQLGTINPKEYTKRFLEAVEAENITALMNFQPPPNPEQQKIQAEMQMKQAEGQQKAQLMQMESQIKQMEAAMDQKTKQMDLAIKAAEAQMEEQKARMEMMHTAQSKSQEMQIKHQEHIQNLQHSSNEHQLSMQHMDEQGKAKADAIKAQAAVKPKGETKK